MHDRISILMGARKIYDREFAKYPGSIYLSKSWIVQSADPLAEYKRYDEFYGEVSAQWIIDTQYSNYL